jgi:hypothetical protein
MTASSVSRASATVASDWRLAFLSDKSAPNFPG